MSLTSHSLVWIAGSVGVLLGSAAIVAASAGSSDEARLPARKEIVWIRTVAHELRLAAESASRTSTPVIAKPTAQTRIGVNLSAPLWYSNERVFSNLALGGFWQIASQKGWPNLAAPFVMPDGSLKAIPPNGEPVRMLVRPATPEKGAMIRCTYSGKGVMTARGSATDVVARPGQITFRWANSWANSNVWLQVNRVDPHAPIGKIDCREADASRTARFDPGFVESLKGYAVIRFMDWERTNDNAVARWADRHMPASIDVTGGTGVAVEDIVALSNTVGADPWVTSPWNADDDYIVQFAKVLHDGISADRSVYVEVGNEVWNNGFPVARQALVEGQARGLGKYPRDTQMQRYAQRTIDIMRLWEQVFADNPKRLVRVVSTQHAVSDGAEIVLRYPGLSEHVDALATAPYFGFDLQAGGPMRDLDGIFQHLYASSDAVIAQAVANKAVATRYGKRYVAYEAGQHVVLRDDVTLLEQIERDPRMYQVYRRYISAWRAKVGDTISFFATTGGIGVGGAWGLQEHSGQSPANAPKLRAVIEAKQGI